MMNASTIFQALTTTAAAALVTVAMGQEANKGAAPNTESFRRIWGFAMCAGNAGLIGTTTARIPSVTRAETDTIASALAKEENNVKRVIEDMYYAGGNQNARKNLTEEFEAIAARLSADLSKKLGRKIELTMDTPHHVPSKHVICSRSI